MWTVEYKNHELEYKADAGVFNDVLVESLEKWIEDIKES